ncbi:MAG TPA: hypothetical protein VKB31_04520 [Trueperaceae bacterium]|nr:hypothetical protein [Trueperaceae bacterium]
MAEGATGRFRVRRDAYCWQVGGGHRHLLRGTLLEGRILRRNAQVRRVVIDTGQGVLTLNEEDLEPAG